MKLFLWQRIEQASDNYHTEGGLVVIAADEVSARAEIAAASEVAVTDDEWRNVRIYELAGDAQPEVIVFPDAGCC